MTDTAERLRFLLRVVHKEVAHLSLTDRRLFAATLSAEVIEQLDAAPDLAERIDAFVSRFSRLQDTLGDKLIPALLQYAGEPHRTVIENLDRAEKLGWIASADGWMQIRKLRNQMIHEYVEDATLLADALNTGHEAVPVLIDVATRLGERVTSLLAR